MKCHIIWRFNLIYNRDKYFLWNLILSEDLIPYAIEQNQKYTLPMVKGEQWRSNFTRARKTDMASFHLRAGKKSQILSNAMFNDQPKNSFWFLIQYSLGSLSFWEQHECITQCDMKTWRPQREKMVVQCIQIISNVQTTIQLHSFQKLAR